MAVAVSPDGKMLAMDLQGSIWVLPVRAAKPGASPIFSTTPASREWSPDGKRSCFSAIATAAMTFGRWAPDGTDQHKLTEGTFDDREPIFSHDGTHIAFSSDRGDPLGSDYNILVLDLRRRRAHGTHHQSGGRHDAGLVAGRPGDRLRLHRATNGHERLGGECRHQGRPQSARGRRQARGSTRLAGVRAANLVYESSERQPTASWMSSGKTITGNEVVFPFRPSWVSADGVLLYRRWQDQAARLWAARQDRSVLGILEVTPAAGTYARRKRDFDGQTPRQALGHRAARCCRRMASRSPLSPWAIIYVMPVARRQAAEHHP